MMDADDDDDGQHWEKNYVKAKFHYAIWFEPALNQIA